MDFKVYLENAFRIFKEEPLILILGGLIVQVLTVLSFGILAGPFLGGYTLLVILYLREGKKPVFSDIFSGMQQFGNLFPYFLVLLLIFLGLVMLILPGLVFATWWLYVLPLMVDRKMNFTDAMRLSMNTVNQKGFLTHFVFLLLVYFIPFLLIELLSAPIPPVQLLKIVLPPLQVGCLASLYIDMFGNRENPAASEWDGETDSGGGAFPKPISKDDTEPAGNKGKETSAGERGPEPASDEER